MTIAVYRITSRETGRIYIGSSVCVEKRWNGHRSHLRRGMHKNRGLQAEWSTYGEPAFDFSIVEVVDDAKIVISREKFHIRMFDAFNPDRGFNVSHPRRNIAGRKMPPVSEATRKNQSEAAKRRGPNQRTAAQNAKLAESQRIRWAARRANGEATLNPEVRAKIVAKCRSPEHRMKLSIAAKKDRSERPMTDETRRKKSLAMKAIWDMRRQQLSEARIG